MVLFADRRDAGRRLARVLGDRAAGRPVVIALPRGGVPVASEVAAALGAPLEVLVVRKLGAPHNPELGIGALAEDGTRVLDAETARALGIEAEALEAIVAREQVEMRRRVDAYRAGRPPLAAAGREAIVVDDGVATGVTDTAALRAIRRLRPSRLVLAVPVCSAEGLERLRAEADEVLALAVPRRMGGVGIHYEDFSQVSDREVIDALRPAADAAG